MLELTEVLEVETWAADNGAVSLQEALRAVAVAVVTKAALSPVQSVGNMWEKSGKIIGFPRVSYGFLWFPKPSKLIWRFHEVS